MNEPSKGNLRIVVVEDEIFIRLDATLEEDFALGMPADDAAPPIAEGEMVLF